VAEAAAAAEDKLRSLQLPRPGDFLRAATLWANLGEWKRSAAMLHVGSVVYPNNEVLKQALAELSAKAGAHVDEVIEKLTAEVQLSVST
jgi:hypothetical protein